MQNMKVLSYKHATGQIRYPFTNDYMFRTVFQQHKKILTGLLCSLLDLQEENIQSVEITNPIVIGENIEAKTFCLDIDIKLNNDTLINLEMQVVNQGDWTDRSLSYLCRTYDHLHRGEKYTGAKIAVHIGILDFTLFPKYPEFYARYKMQNVKNQHIFNDKFCLNVLCLPQVDIATEHDKNSSLDYWAALFKARTWEDIRMLAEKNQNMSEAVQALYESNADDMVRRQCQAREDALAHERYVTAKIARLEKEVADLKARLAELTKSST